MIVGYGQKCNNYSDVMKNSYLIQIYKSYYSEIVAVGMNFILGYKSANELPSLLKIAKKEHIS